MTEHACPSELLLDRLVVGELEASRSEPLRMHVAACQRCTGRVAERDKVAASFARDVGLDMLVQAATLRVRKPTYIRTASIVAGAVAAAAILIVVLRRDDSRTDEAAGIRRKGSIALAVYAKRLDGNVEALTSPARLAPNEAIRFAISAGSAGFVGIVGIDSAGVVTPYVPPALGPARRIEAGRDQLLEGSIVLDATLGPERIVTVLCDDELHMSDLVAWATAALQRAGGNPARIDALAVRPTCTQTAFLIDKQDGGAR